MVREVSGKRGGGGGGGGEIPVAAAAHMLDVVLFCLIRLVTSIAFSGFYGPTGIPIESFTFELINTKLKLVNS